MNVMVASCFVKETSVGRVRLMHLIWINRAGSWESRAYCCVLAVMRVSAQSAFLALAILVKRPWRLPSDVRKRALLCATQYFNHQAPMVKNSNPWLRGLLRAGKNQR